MSDDNNDRPKSPPTSPWGSISGGTGDKPSEDKNNDTVTNGPWGNFGGNFGGNNGDNRPKNPQNNPWGGNTGNNESQSQNLDDLAKRIEDRIKGVLGGGGGNGRNRQVKSGELDPRTLGYLGLGIIALWLASGIYKVDAGEQAIVTRFGKFVRVASDGLNYRLPTPFEKHRIVNVQRVNTLTVGANLDGSSNANDETSSNGLMLTGDENIVNVGFQVFWRVNNVGDYVFNVAHGPDNKSTADSTISAVAEAAMREVVGKTQLEKVLTTGRAQVEQQAKDLMQKTLDQYRSGIVITQVNLRRSEPPSSVVDSFRQVAAASQEAETKVNQALAYRNSVVPQAQGEAARFNQLYQEYKLAPEVTRQRLYLETMEKVYERANKVIVDNKAGGGTMMVLPPELLKPKTDEAAKSTTNGGNQ